MKKKYLLLLISTLFLVTLSPNRQNLEVAKWIKTMNFHNKKYKMITVNEYNTAPDHIKAQLILTGNKNLNKSLKSLTTSR